MDRWKIKMAGNSTTFGAIQIDQLNSANYQTWFLQIKCVLMQKGIEKLVEAEIRSMKFVILIKSNIMKIRRNRIISTNYSRRPTDYLKAHINGIVKLKVNS